MNRHIEIYCDGGARGNPGKAAYGCVLEIRPARRSPRLAEANGEAQVSAGGNSKFEIRKKELSGYLGITTNNQAEYQAVIHGLGWIKKNFKAQSASWRTNVKFYIDSQLVVEQLNGRYKIKNQGLKPLYWQVRDLVVELGGVVEFYYIPRYKNKKADLLVNKILDEHV